MNHCVPDFEMDEDYSFPCSSSSSLTRAKKTAMGEDDIMELLWQNGQVVAQSKNQRSFKKSNAGEAEIPAAQSSAAREIHTDNMPQNHQQQQLLMHEDEMAAWLHYPLDESSFDRNIYSDLLYPQPSAPTTNTPSTPPREIRTIVTEIRPLPPPPAPSISVAPRPPIPPPSRRTDVEAAVPNFQNFMSGLPKPRIKSGPPSSSRAARELTAADSNETPTTVGPSSMISMVADSTVHVSGENVGCGTTSGTAAVGTSTAARELATTCELTVSSSPGGSAASVSASEDRKRKGREPDDAECHSEDIEFESADAKKQARGSTSTKRSRAAEVHNLSERRRRDRINEKMRALQELIPRCNKSDKASMLDEAIEYLKSLQLQVQMMSMGCGMLPMMYPGVQPYMPAMGMGMGMGMSMDMGMNRPMMPYPHLIPGSGIPNPAAAMNMGPRFPGPAFHMQPVPVPDPSRIQASSQPDPLLNSLVAHNPNQPRMPNFADSYQQFIGLHQAQVPIPHQSQVVVQPSTNKPSRSRDVGNPENHQSG